jgi:deoxyribodipyrimidine photo-lyase
MPSKINLFWFRRDLRLDDNKGLYEALSGGLPVVPIFILDKNILDELTDRKDKRVQFIYDALLNIQKQLNEAGSTLVVRYGKPLQIFSQLIKEYSIEAVFTNHDYEPYATERDRSVKELLQKNNIQFKTYKDQVIFEKDEVVKDDGSPYSVFTPFSKRWKAQLTKEDYKSYPSEKLADHFHRQKTKNIPSLKEMGFEEAPSLSIEPSVNLSVVKQYDKTRDIPSVQGTTRLGIHLRFGTTSVRQLVKKALELNQIFLNELIWREFFMQMLWQQPRLVNEACKKEYDNIKWRNNEKEFEAWCNGETGYPIVDAGMRELNETGFMHNRVRMITASFLVKHLLIDWRWGEAYFAKKLLDYELASNNGNWQWVAGCGCDAAPYFRIFNPTSQTKKFDPQLKYIHQWVPEFEILSYAKPIVDHEMARERCLNTYKKALQKARLEV